jgi:hypothetical protein
MSLVVLDDNRVNPVIDVDTVADCEESVRLYGATNVVNHKALTAKRRPNATEPQATYDAVPGSAAVTASDSPQVWSYATCRA